MKKIAAVHPFHYPSGSNFKEKPFFAWEEWGGKTIKGIYPPRFLRKFIHSYDVIPTISLNKREARLCFVQPLSIYFDTFSSVLNHEIVLFVWDCWPCFDNKLCGWIKLHHVRACIFTSSIAAERIRERLPWLQIHVITEGITVKEYPEGLPLANRDIDLFLFGRWPGYASRTNMSLLKVAINGTDKEFRKRLQHSKITINVPRCDVVPKQTGEQETLTQRYWECMLSRMVMVGRAPQELTDLIGYNPVIDIDKNNLANQLNYIVTHIEDYQELVNKNRETALSMGNWDIRIKQVMEWLEDWDMKCKVVSDKYIVYDENNSCSSYL